MKTFLHTWCVNTMMTTVAITVALLIYLVGLYVAVSISGCDTCSGESSIATSEIWSLTIQGVAFGSAITGYFMTFFGIKVETLMTPIPPRDESRASHRANGRGRNIPKR